MKLLTLTSLFPGSAAPRHGVFVRERMADYRTRYGAEIEVVAPVPYYPRWLPGRRYAHFARTPREEEWGGFRVRHPRYLMIPKIGVPLQGLLYHSGVKDTVRRRLHEFRFDLIDAHYAYPDGFAAALLKQRLRVPLALTVRGTDVNLMPGYRSLRGQVRFALQSADAVIAVSKALAELAVQAGADPGRVVTLRNGVDPELFRPLDQDRCRRELELEPGRRVLASVGFLIPRKAQDVILRALSGFPEPERPMLLLAGDGPEEGRLRRLAGELGLSDQVRFLGGVEHGALAAIYSAADLSVLVSSREGWPNVLLESMACGTPVIASAVHGSVEVVANERVGLLLRERTPEALRAAIRAGFAQGFDRREVRSHAEGMGWERTSAGLHEVFSRLVR
jgi:glycosyltransferase involved in cell wall biosynthesis